MIDYEELCRWLIKVYVVADKYDSDEKDKKVQEFIDNFVFPRRG